MYQQVLKLRYLANLQKQGIAASEHEAVFPWRCHDELLEKMGANFSLLPLLQLHIFPQPSMNYNYGSKCTQFCLSLGQYKICK
jgi:hypothetical protein